MNINASVDIDDRHRLYVKSDECDYKMLVAENVKGYILHVWESERVKDFTCFSLTIEHFDSSICRVEGEGYKGELWLRTNVKV